MLAVRPRVICLDEPTAGVAQREAEAFGPLIKRIQHELDATLVVVEHDLPLIMSISDRIYCLEAGGVIAHGDARDGSFEPPRRLVVPRHRRPRDPAFERRREPRDRVAGVGAERRRACPTWSGSRTG